MLDKRIPVNEALNKKSKGTVVAGWVENLRTIGSITFVDLRDRTGKIQIVALKKSFNPEKYKSLEKLTPESVIAAKGNIQESKAKGVKYELVLEDFEVLSKAETPLPIDLEENTTTNIDKRLDNRFLDTRRKKINFGTFAKNTLHRVFLVLNFGVVNGIRTRTEISTNSSAAITP